MVKDFPEKQDPGTVLLGVVGGGAKQNYHRLKKINLQSKNLNQRE